MNPMRPGPGMRGHLTEEEKANAPKVTKELLLRILGYLKPYRLQLFFVFVAILLSALLGLLPSVITGKIVGEALVNKDMRQLVTLCLAALAAVAASELIGVLERFINAWISCRIIFDMKNEMYRHLEYMPHTFFTTEKQGDIITRMNTDISGISDVIGGTLAKLVSNLATVVTTTVALFSMSWQLALVGMVIIPLILIPSRRVGKTRFKLATQSQQKSDELNQIINETLSVSGSMLLKLFTREEKEYANFVRVNEECSEINLQEMRSDKWLKHATGMLMQFGPILIYLVGGCLLIGGTKSSVSIATITATIALVNRLYRPIENLMDSGVSFTRSLALFNRIFDYLDRPITITSPENGKKPDMEQKDIVYDHMSFRYSEDKPLLEDISFTVPGGKMYAIVGPSGCGKSTVVNMIPRLYDADSGTVSIGGVDVKEMDLFYLRSNIGVVTQDTYLFNGTIRENLLYAKEGATEEQLIDACKKASIYDFIMRQPKGFDTEVGNRGLKLSGGEKQRISIARVILKDPKILILDEATSALDSISENAIQDALSIMMQGRTSIVIAHRLSTILKADRILVVSDGIIAEEGTHEELLAKNGIYRELYETQFRIALDYEASAPTELGLEIDALSTDYEVRRLTAANTDEVYRLAKSNMDYYERIRTDPTREYIQNRITEIPEGLEKKQVHPLGFYDKDGSLVGALRLITAYPEKDDAFIYTFMVDGGRHSRGIGSRISADIRASLSAQGYDYLYLGVVKENTRAEHFWRDQGFTPSGMVLPAEDQSILLMSMDI